MALDVGDAEVFTCRQLTVSEAHADVVQSHRAAVPEALAGADENHLSSEQRRQCYNASGIFPVL